MQENKTDVLRVPKEAIIAQAQAWNIQAWKHPQKGLLQRSTIYTKPLAWALEHRKHSGTNEKEENIQDDNKMMTNLYAER